jgi:hypothetical protein
MRINSIASSSATYTAGGFHFSCKVAGPSLHCPP